MMICDDIRYNLMPPQTRTSRTVHSILTITNALKRRDAALCCAFTASSGVSVNVDDSVVTPPAPAHNSHHRAPHHSRCWGGVESFIDRYRVDDRRVKRGALRHFHATAALQRRKLGDAAHA